LLVEPVVWLLTHDFCPWANRYADWLRQPLTVLALTGGMALIIGWSVAPQGFVVFASVVAVILVGIAWPWVGTLGLHATLRFGRLRVREGERVSARLTVINHMPWPVWGLVLEGGWVPQATPVTEERPKVGNGVLLALDRVPGWSQCEFVFDLEPRLRGEYPRGIPRLSTAFPFGLWRSMRPVATPSRLLVWPQIVRLKGMPSPCGDDWAAEMRSLRRSGQEGEVLGTRPYRRGDLLRHVHWPQTARHGHLIVCERQVSGRAAVRVWFDVDLRPSANAHSAGEWTLRIVASLCRLCVMHQVRLVVQWQHGFHVVEPTDASERKFNDALATFPLARGRDVASHHRATQCAPAQRHGERELRIVVTSNLEVRHRPPDTGGLRPILLFVGSGTGLKSSPQPRGPAAIEVLLDVCGDVAAQLRDEWARICRHAGQLS
jgi:uncharacterized protein (DUF58 family)